MLDKSTIIVNGKKINFTGNAVINIRKDISSDKDKKFDMDKKGRMIIEINGDIGNLVCGDANIIINGNANKVITQNGKIECGDVDGKIICLSLDCKNIKGTVKTNGNIICDTFIGNTNIGKVIDNFKPIKKRSDFKEGLLIYHKSYGKGLIKSIYSYNTHTGGSLTVEFDSEEYSKTLMIDKVIKNESISLFDNTEIIKEYEEELTG